MNKKSTTYEYEERAFLSEDQFLRVKAFLDKSHSKKNIDNKQSFFFVMPDINISIADSEKETKIKYKGGQLGKGNGFEEIECRVEKTSLSEAIKLFTKLLDTAPQTSFQFRINYSLEDSVELALKYTEMWGFHIEVECVYSATSSTDRSAAQAKCQSKLDAVARTLGIRYITDKEMAVFTEECKQNKLRGAYNTHEFTEKFGKLFGL